MASKQNSGSGTTKSFPHLNAQSEDDYRESATRIAQYIANALGAPGCSIFLASEPGKYSLEATTGRIQPTKGRVYYQSGEGLTGWVVKHAKRLRIKNVYDTTEQKTIAPDLAWQVKYTEPEEIAPRITSFLGAPILAAGHVLGVIRVVGRNRPFTVEDEERLVELCQELSRQLMLWPNLLRAVPEFGEIYHADDSAIRVIKAFNAATLASLARNPDDIQQLSSRMFEELIAELLYRDGWQVELTLQTRDGGYDMAAVRSVNGVGIQLLVEAKKYRQDRPVGVSIIRSLYAVKHRKHASKAMLATSSYVSPDAKEEFRDVIPWELDIREYDDLTAWLKRHGGLHSEL